MECVFEEIGIVSGHEVFVDEELAVRSSERDDVLVGMPYKLGDIGIVVPGLLLIFRMTGLSKHLPRYYLLGLSFPE